ncbi:hypothetical protein HPB48_004321 [Haemaphysalis longicornis]|uniref:Uncharacterized protein n=1 Tax=Haemaphysalis longicornis TaxID=44386 RepID=A0A9J6FRH0_HAELO|nr:hypothetical protein HPB48_004321 [Haemaphysalis longicornis]
MTRDMIRNCFGHTGFVVGSENEDSDTIQNPTAEMPPACRSIRYFRASGFDVGAATFEDFTNIDSANLPRAELDDGRTLRRVLEPAEVNSDCDDDMPPTPEA